MLFSDLPGTAVEPHSKTMVLNLWVASPFVGQMTLSQGLHNRCPGYQLFTLQFITVAKSQL